MNSLPNYCNSLLIALTVHCSMVFYKYITDNAIALFQTILRVFRIKSKPFSRANRALQDLNSTRLSGFSAIIPLLHYIVDTLSISLSHLREFALAFPSRMFFLVIVFQDPLSINLQAPDYLVLWYPHPLFPLWLVILSQCFIFFLGVITI